MVAWHHRLNGHEFKQALGDIKSVTVSIVSPSIHREMMGPDAMMFGF